jgi:hypothetical protein
MLVGDRFSASFELYSTASELIQSACFFIFKAAFSDIPQHP